MKRFTKQKEIEFKLDSIVGIVAVKLSIPDLTGKDVDSYGDWGPNITFNLDAKNPIKVVYKFNNQSIEESLEVSELQFRSPISYQQRKATPFYFVIRDVRRALDFKVWLGNDGNIVKTDCRFLKAAQEHIQKPFEYVSQVS